WLGGTVANHPLQQAVESTRLGVPGSVLLILVSAVRAPRGGELLFRGVLPPRLLPNGQVWAVGVSAVVFALLHPFYGLYMPVILLYGVVLGWARVRTGGLVAPVLLHMTVNAAAAGVLLMN